MAIAFDNSTLGPGSGAAQSSLSWSHTTGSGSNRVLIVALNVGEVSSDPITGVTYNGVAMTRGASDYYWTGPMNWLSIWYLVNPPSGTYTVVASCSSAYYMVGGSASYSGVAQTGFPDNSANHAQAGATTNTVSLTTGASNCWTAAVFADYSGTAMSAGSGTTLRQYQVASAGHFGFALTDSNGAVSGSTSLAVTSSDSGNGSAGLMVSFAPVAGGTTKTITGTSRITITSTQTLSGKARVTATTPKTLTGKASIKRISTQTQTGKGYILIGTIKTQTGKASILGTTARTQTGKANIAFTTSKTQSGKASVIFVYTTNTQTGKASVLNGSFKYQSGRSYIYVAPNYAAKCTPQGTTFGSKFSPQGTQFLPKYIRPHQ